jgi:hypothetical protein
MVVDYQKGKIYKMVTVSGLTYIGSTCQSLALRKAAHTRDYKKYKNGKYHYITCFKLFEDNIDNIDIVLIENVNCHNKEELHQRERFYIESTDCVNKFIVGRTIKEYREDNKDKIKEYLKKYYEKNRDILKEKCKCVCNSIFRKRDKARHEHTIKHQNFIKYQIIKIA